MARNPSRRTAIVADRRPLERSLARFLLEERGLFVVGEAATMADVLLQVQQHRPDLVVLHEKLAEDHDPSVIAQIRRVSPPTSIVLLAASRASLAPELLLLADTVVEDGPGFTELGAAIVGGSSAMEAAPTGESDLTPEPSPYVRPDLSPTARRWVDRLQGIAVASIIGLAFIFARDATQSIQPQQAQVHIDAALASLDDIEEAADAGGDRSDRGVGAPRLDRARTRRRGGCRRLGTR
jgi:CheY-like chemotaxis protein